MVTTGLWNLHVDGKWFRWFHPPRGQSSSPDTPTTLDTIREMLSKPNTFKWDPIPFPTPLHMQLDYVYTIDEDTGNFTVTRWTGTNGTVYPKAYRATLDSIRETSLETIESLLEEVVEMSEHNDHQLSDETDVQLLLKSFQIKPNIPAQLNELQFQLFTDFVFNWRFYFDGTSTWESSFPTFATLAIGLLRIAAWDFEVRNAGAEDLPEDLPLTFSSLPEWKAPADDIFWFHRYLVVCCNTDQIRNSIATKANDFVSRSKNHTRTVHGIAISIRHVALFKICDGQIFQSPPIPLVTSTSALDCSPGFRILAYLFTSDRWKGFSADSKENWGVTIPTELFDMILKASTPKDLVSTAQASFLVEKWYYSSIPQICALRLHNFAFSIPCCGKRDISDAPGVYCSVCYAWSHVECAGLSSNVAPGTDKYICSDCQETRPCSVLETGGIHQTYRTKRVRKACSVVHGGKTTDLLLRNSRPSSHRPELWLIRTHGAPPPRTVDYTIFFSGIFSGLAYGFD
ncbi:unnamed protein product [Penicillium nalgiovense]|uniref:Uncharacterized protein n=1 Tax=Penicillium nalgiovense TaxID=60175 RepID=A0A9W4MMT5_PENNA|nr:unnamed protein product [Penicillium nalgiovense]CAG7979736.1 unnamed protein product [Penicillium nalgiovense]CAG8002730.1 unnamed protein product [Penicillium nalgiovense]CAG8011997.1 unnamed protein product [Penicillium nalgiovense]CAG8021040.1 unnamed protein product [Penicillium nalgiovense]